MRTEPQPDKERSTLVVPAVAAGIAVVVMVVETVFVLPRFETFQSFHAKLPLPTRMLLAFSHFMGPAGRFFTSRTGWLIVAIIVCSVLAAVDYFRTPSGRAKKDRLLLRVPVAADLLKHDTVERFKRYFGPVVTVFVVVVLGFVAISLIAVLYSICSVYNQVNI